MAIRSYQLTLAAAAKRLSQVYGDADSLANQINEANDIPYRYLMLQATGADAYIGVDSTTTSTTYGTKVASADTQPISLGHYDAGPIRLSDIWVAGNGAVIHVTGVPF